MATSSSYYLNAPSLGSATAVFLDEALSECAPNGYYSNGVIVREQVDCVLLPQQSCPSCATYNCVEGTCTDPGDGTGTYATLEECQAVCATPTIALGSPICRQNNCNDNAACSVRYGINTTYAPVGSYITLTTDTPSSSATVTVSDSTPPIGEILYFEPSGSATPVYFTLQLRNSGGTIIATSSTSLTHQSFWPMLTLC